MAGCHSFCLFFIFFITYIHTFIQLHSSIAIRWGLSPSPHCLKAQWEDPPCGAEPRIELGPALQQADALPTEPRRTIDWATPHHDWATPHHNWATPHHNWATPHHYWATPHHWCGMAQLWSKKNWHWLDLWLEKSIEEGRAAIKSPH